MQWINVLTEQLQRQAKREWLTWRAAVDRVGAIELSDNS